MKSKTILAVLATSVVFVACGGSEKSASPGGAPAPAPATQATVAAAPAASIDLSKGKEIYASTCAACHGASGKGDGPGAANLNPRPRDFSDKDYMARLNDTDIRNTVKYGGAIKGMPQMPSHPQFSEADLTSLVAYVRTLSGPEQTASK